MFAMEDGVGHALPLQHHKGQGEDDAYGGHYPYKCFQHHIFLIAHQPHDILCHEHGHEGVAGQQIYAALALGYAVEEQDEAEAEPCKHL